MLVVLWTAFPSAFSAIMTTVYIPLALAALGIVLRGSGFAFRHALPGPVQGPATRVFGVASVLTPFFMGTVVGAIASGEVPAAGDGDPDRKLDRVPAAGHRGAVRPGGGLHGRVFLVRDSGAAGDQDLRDYFSRRALIVAAVVGRQGAVLGVIALHQDARFIYDGLTSWPGIALVVLSGSVGWRPSVSWSRAGIGVCGWPPWAPGSR